MKFVTYWKNVKAAIKEIDFMRYLLKDSGISVWTSPNSYFNPLPGIGDIVIFENLSKL